MPTGYTAAIADGITFPSFVLQCARAMGACIMMRDEPQDAPIPDKFKPSDYSAARLQEAKDRLRLLESMTEDECNKNAAEMHSAERARIMLAIQKGEELLAKYESMLKQVESWNPPTSDHVGLKKFMTEQIKSSIEFDCMGSYYQNLLEKLELKTGEEWRAAQIAEENKNIAYHSKSQAEEEERTNQRNEWIRQLRESI